MSTLFSTTTRIVPALTEVFNFSNCTVIALRVSASGSSKCLGIKTTLLAKSLLEEMHPRAYQSLLRRFLCNCCEYCNQYCRELHLSMPTTFLSDEIHPFTYPERLQKYLLSAVVLPPPGNHCAGTAGVSNKPSFANPHVV